MIKKTIEKAQQSMFFTLKDTLDQRHPLYQLTKAINWEQFEKLFSPLYCQDNGRPCKPIRLMVGLLILKHLRNLSDESVVEQWSENLYYQYFCGESEFVAGQPCDASELVHFRNRIGEVGIEQILKESIRINGEDSKEEAVNIDTTVQEKNITYPIDDKLYKRIIKRCRKISEEEGLPVRQSYTRTLKQLSVIQRFRNNAKSHKKVKKADKKVKTIAGRLLRELERNLGEGTTYQKEIELYKRVLNQGKNDKDKIYSLHEPEVKCISKGKAHKKHEFGNKVSIVLTQYTRVIVGALSFRNPYDGHTLPETLSQTERILDGQCPKRATVDRGYRWKDIVNGVVIQTPKPFNKKQTKYKQVKIKKDFTRRAGIEPIIGHLKQDHRLGRNFYKGIIGDSMNLMLAAAAFNFKRMMRKWKSSFWRFFDYKNIWKYFFKSDLLVISPIPKTTF